MTSVVAPARNTRKWQDACKWSDVEHEPFRAIFHECLVGVDREVVMAADGLLDETGVAAENAKKT